MKFLILAASLLLTIGVANAHVIDHTHNPDGTYTIVTPTVQPAESCVATGATLGAARAAYNALPNCNRPRKDCDRAGNTWTCSADRIGDGAPGAPVTPSQPSSPVVVPSPGVSPVVPAPVATGTSLRIQAESAQIPAGSSWLKHSFAGSDGLLYNGPNRFGNQGPEARNTIEYRVTIPRDGEYRFMMRHRATRDFFIGNKSEAPNDVFMKFGSLPWTKVFYNKGKMTDKQWHIGAVGDHGRTTKARLKKGVVSVFVAGRSNGNAIDYIELRPIGFKVDTVEAPKTIPGGRNVGRMSAGDLLSVHWDVSKNDIDDVAAMIATREMLDAYPEIDSMTVFGTTGAALRPKGVTGGGLAHARGLFPNIIDAFGQREAAIAQTAARWATTLRAGKKVWVAAGGPMDFSADVIQRLRAQGVKGTKNITVVQHSHGRGFNERMTSSQNMNLIKSAARYQPIDNGNHGNNRTPNWEIARDDQWRTRAYASKYGSQWRWALRFRTEIDFSDAVEVVYILDVKGVNTIGGFANKFF